MNLAQEKDNVSGVPAGMKCTLCYKEDFFCIG